MNEYNNPSIVENSDGTLGLDFLIDYRGNIATWGNKSPHNTFNVYNNSYQEFMLGTLDNIFDYSLLDKGYSYREKVIDPVNHLAIIRSKALNLREISASVLIEENKTKLYFSIIAIKDYLKEGILLEDDISFLSDDIKSIINLPISEIQKLYNESNYDIVKQYFEKKEILKQIDWDILFTLIRLGHYKVSKENLKIAFDYYNKTYNCKINSVNDIKDIDNDFFYNRVFYGEGN